MSKLKLSKIFNFLTHPIAIFIALQVICVAITVLWVVWYTTQNEALAQLSQLMGNQNVDMDFSVVMLVVGCVLLGFLLVGTLFLFIFAQRKAALFNQQRSFVSSVTHELRSPLASLQLAFETLTSRVLPQQIAERFYSMILSDISRLSKLIDQILISSKLDKGIFVSDKQEFFKVNELIATATSQLSYLDQNLSQRISIQCPDDLQMLTVKSMVGLILGNLIENAVKYSPENSPIQIEATCSATNNNVVFCVKDYGFGLNKRDHKKIFRMFHRSEVAVKQAISGTGLGLFIVKSAATGLGGKVWVESPGAGLGSSFFVSLPAQAN